MIKKALYIFFILLNTISIFASDNLIEPNLLRKTDKASMDRWVDSVFNTMSLDEKIGQTIMVMADGRNSAANRKLLTDYVKKQYIGSIIFSKSNPVEQAELTNVCQENARIPLMVALDGEWGLSMRLENTTRFPQNMMIGAIQEDSLVYYYGLEVARQCKEMGIHVNFAPDIDVNSNPSNPVIGRRSYGEDPKMVARLGIMYSKGLEDGGVLSVAKHFPGHGDTSTDSHKVLPLINHSKERLDSIEIYPFREYINAGLGGIMTAHLNIPVLDKSGSPSSLSKPIVTDLLQKDMGFSGLTFTDGLAMKGVSDASDMSVRIIKAGNDILLGPISPVKEFNALKKALENGTIDESLIEERCKKILKYKYILGVPQTKKIDTDSLSIRLNTSYAEWLTRKMNEKAITLLKNTREILPIKNLDKNKIASVAIGISSGNQFQETLKLYDNITCFNVSDVSGLGAIKSKLAGYNTVIVSIHQNKTFNVEAIRNLIDGKKSILVLFTSPYRMGAYSSVVNKSDVTVMAYENTHFAQEYAAQGIFGGNRMEGKLPVTVRGLYKRGEGLETQKTRLSYSVPEEVGLSATKLDGIEKIVQEGIQEKAFPGCQVLIAKDGVIIYNKSFGSFEYDRRQPVTNENLYDIASMTKATATVPALMMLYDEKRFTLRNPVSQYVTTLKGSDKENITIREALFHETGISSFIPYYMPSINKDSYAGRLFSNRQTEVYHAQFDETTWARTDYKYLPNLISSTPKLGYELQITDNLFANSVYKDTIINAIAASKLKSKNYRYSCLNFILLKEVVEKIAKTDMNSFLQDNLYKKLGAITTTYNPLKKFEKDQIVPTEKDDFLRKQLLQGYVHDEGAAFLGGISGNAGLFSNANDLAKIYQMFLNQGMYGGERLISKETCRMFTTTKSPNSRRGLGFDKPDLRSNKVSPCSPQTPVSTYGHTGFTGTCFWVDPDNNLIYIFLSNRVYPKRTQKNLTSLNIRPRIQEEIYNAIKK